MGLNIFSWFPLLSWVFLFVCLIARCEDVTVNLLKTPATLSPQNSATFVFQVLEGPNVCGCTNFSTKCKLDDQIPSDCKFGNVSYMGLLDGEHKFEVCTNGSQGVGCASYNWTVDTVPPTADVIARKTFTNSPNVSVDISFSEPCTGGGGFGCSSLNSCNLLARGAGQVIPSTLKILQPGLKFSLLVGLSSNVQNGLVQLSMNNVFCTDNAGNRFTSTENSSFIVRFDRRSVMVHMRTHVPEKLIEYEGENVSVLATNDRRRLRVCLNFSEPLLNSSKEIQSSLHVNVGILVRVNQKSLGNRRFGFFVRNLSSPAAVSVSFNERFIVSRYGSPVSAIEPVYFIYDTERPFMTVITASKRTRDDIVPVKIMFLKPVFDFNFSAITISGGQLNSSEKVDSKEYKILIKAEGDNVSVHVPENITRDVAGNANLASSTLQVKHYSVPVISSVVSIFATTSFSIASLAAGLLSVSTASLQSVGALSSPSSLTSDPTRNLFGMACHIQVFALSKWLPVTMPVEYYEFARAIQWSIPYISLPWESKNDQSIMIDSRRPSSTHSNLSKYHELRTFENMRLINEKLKIVASSSGLTIQIKKGKDVLSICKSLCCKPDAEALKENEKVYNAWKEFNRNMFWLAVIGGSLMLVHGLVFFILNLRRKNLKRPRCYGPLIPPRFEIFLLSLALPCICQASATLIGGEKVLGLIVAVLLYVFVSISLLALLVFLTVGITMGKLLEYEENVNQQGQNEEEEVLQQGQNLQWYQHIGRVILGSRRSGYWKWKNQSNSVLVTMIGPLFEDLRGPLKNMVLQIFGRKENSNKPSDCGGGGGDGDRINSSDGVETPFIKKLFGILRIYYAALEPMRRVILAIIAGSYTPNESSRVPIVILLCISTFYLLFVLLGKPSINRNVQLAEIISIACEVGIFATTLHLQRMKRSVKDEQELGIFMLSLFIIGFLAQLINEAFGLFKQTCELGEDKSFSEGLKEASIGLVSLWNPCVLGKKGGGEDTTNTTTSKGRFHQNSMSSSGSTNMPQQKQQGKVAKANFSKEEDVGAPPPPEDPSSIQIPRSGSTLLALSQEMHEDKDKDKDEDIPVSVEELELPQTQNQA